MPQLMRIHAANMFLLPIFSYVQRIIMLPVRVVRDKSNKLLRFITPLTFCTLDVFCHLNDIAKTRIRLRDIMIENIAALSSTVCKLHHQDITLLVRQNGPANLDNPCPIQHASVAYLLFHHISGATVEVLFDERQLQCGQRGLHRAFYNFMISKDHTKVRDYVRGRIRDKGLQDTAINNLGRLPTTTPESHRYFLLCHLLNGVTTSVRRRYNGEHTSACTFCKMSGGDTRQHWTHCPVLQRCAGNIYPNVDVLSNLSPDGLYLQVRMEGGTLQHVAAFWHGVWRCRNVVMRGYDFHNEEDLINHIRHLCEDPWICGDPARADRATRRRARIRPPECLSQHIVYNSDGASRTEPNADTRLGSCGVIVRAYGEVAGRYAEYLGDVTKNVAEYTGSIRESNGR